jgi:hypothetical protein
MHREFFLKFNKSGVEMEIFTCCGNGNIYMLVFNFPYMFTTMKLATYAMF